MGSENNYQKRYLKFGAVAVCIHCPTTAFADEACEHIFLSKSFDGATIANIRYFLDDSIEDQVAHERKDNVVYIKRNTMDDGREKIVLGMFNSFTAVLEVGPKDVFVRYSYSAPVRLLLDDVLQAALQPVLDRMGGFILHGACMVRNNKAIVLMGNSGSGKSTTAFNLTRFGFCGYADDAVLVTPQDGILTVWPLTRELSLRPLSFRLFKKQGIGLGHYKKYDEKYYFPQTTQTQSGAVLEHICFLEISGETESKLIQLNKKQSQDILTANNRHFSFMGRTDASKYARILSDGVPVPLQAKLGTDLEFQGIMYSNLFSDEPENTQQKTAPSTKMATRSQKSAFIRQAWASPKKEPLEQLIPLLSDFDPSIFKLALGFFQTLPMASLLPIEDPAHGSQRYTTVAEQQANDPVPWFKTDSWLQGCKALLAQSGEEVFQRFIYAWIKSAPLLYPYLKYLLADQQQYDRLLTDAWARYCSERPKSSAKRRPDQIHLIGIHQTSAWATTDAREWLQHKFSLNQPHRHLYCWVDEGERSDWKALVDKLNLPRGVKTTIVPVLSTHSDVGNAVNFVREARAHGICAVMTRQVPFCRLKGHQAHWLMDSSALDLNAEKHDGEQHFFNSPGISTLKPTNANTYGLSWAEPVVRYLSKPYDDCNFCRLATLGMCRGGFFVSSKT